MTTEFKLKDVLAAVDLDGKEVWDELSDEQRKKRGIFYAEQIYFIRARKPRAQRTLSAGR